MSGDLFVLRRKQEIHATLKDVWSFFSSPHNLQRITPGTLGFQIIECPEVEEIYTGMRIEYTVRPLLGIPVRWITEITEVQAPYRFADVQLRGPYKSWKHEHSFIETEKGVLMEDVVRYSVGYGFAGTWINRWVVEKKLSEIFDFRQQKVNKIFNKQI